MDDEPIMNNRYRDLGMNNDFDRRMWPHTALPTFDS